MVNNTINQKHDFPVSQIPLPCDIKELKSKTHPGNFYEVGTEGDEYKGQKFWHELKITDLYKGSCLGYLENFSANIKVNPLSVVIVNQNEISNYQKRRHFVKEIFGFEGKPDFNCRDNEPSYIFNLLGNLVDGRANQSDLCIKGGSAYEHDTFFRSTGVYTKSDFGFVSFPVNVFDNDSIFFQRDAECFYKFFQIERLNEMKKTYSEFLFIVTTDFIPNTQIFTDFIQVAISKKVNCSTGFEKYLSRSPGALLAIIKETLLEKIGINSLLASKLSKRVDELSKEVLNIFHSKSYSDEEKRNLITSKISELSEIRIKAKNCSCYLNDVRRNIFKPLKNHRFVVVDIPNETVEKECITTETVLKILEEEDEFKDMSQNQKKKILKQRDRQLRKHNAKKAKQNKQEDCSSTFSKSDSLGCVNNGDMTKKSTSVRSTKKMDYHSERQNLPDSREKLNITSVLQKKSLDIVCKDEFDEMNAVSKMFRTLERNVLQLVESVIFNDTEKIGVDISAVFDKDTKQPKYVHLESMGKSVHHFSDSQKLFTDLANSVQNTVEAIENPGKVKNGTSKFELECMSEIYEAQKEIEVSQLKQKGLGN